MICLYSLVRSVNTASSGKPKYAVCHMASWIWICRLLEFPNSNQEHFSQSSHIDVCDADLTPPRAVTAKKICAGVATFFSDAVKNATVDLLVLLKNYDFWFSTLMLGQIFILYTELKYQGLLLSGKRV